MDETTPPPEPQAAAPAGMPLPPGAPESLAGAAHHMGKPLRMDGLFFVPPPEEIGPVVTADTTLVATDRPKSMRRRMVISGGIFLVFGALVPWFLAASMAGDTGRVVGSVLGFIAFLAAIIAWFALRFRRHCTYVGERGVSHHRLSDNPSNPVKAENFLFESAAELRVSETRHYQNGVYTGTHYRFDWTDASGKRVHRISGSYRSEAGTPKDKDLYHFARSAEAAWSNWMLPRIREEYEQTGQVEFEVSPKKRVRIGQGVIEFDLGGKVETVPVDEIETAQIRSGEILLKARDAARFGKRGKFKFRYARMPNARLFIFAVERLLGLRLT